MLDFFRKSIIFETFVEKVSFNALDMCLMHNGIEPDIPREKGR